jgi:hypothetical protein
MFSTFIFCETTLKQINDLPQDLRLKFYDAVANYGIFGVEPKFTGLEHTIWISMKDIIDMTKGKRGKRQKAGKKGGESKRDSSTETPSKTDFATAPADCLSKTDFAVANGNGNGNVNGNGNGNENVNVNGEPSPSFPPFSRTTALKPAYQAEPTDPDTTGPPQKNYAAIFEEVKSKWEEVIGQKTRETLLTVSPTRRERFINTLELYSLEDIFNAIGNYKIARSDPEQFDIKGRVYGTLIGFLENGVSQFYEDDVASANFRRQKHDG